MNVRGLAVLAGLVALGGWLASGPVALRGPAAPPPQPEVTPPPPIAVEAAGIRSGVRRLQARSGEAPSLPAAARNPFRFHERQPAPEPVPSPPDPGPVLSAARGPAPDLRLIGVAEDPGPEGPQRTAVVSGLDQLFFLKVGDLFAGHFKVVGLSADAIQIEDSTTGTTFTLTMR